jgi:hypothetical protein
MGSFARLDPPLAGVRREVGPLLLAWHFIAELDLIATVDRALPQRGRQHLSVGEAVAALILDSACGQPKTLCEIARADLRFIVPLRAQTGFREQFLADVGQAGLSPLRYVSQREQRLPAELRSRYRGALDDWELTDPETGETHRFRVAYIHSSEEQREAAAARERALAKAEEQLQRVHNGLGGRYYKTRKQVDPTRVDADPAIPAEQRSPSGRAAPRRRVEPPAAITPNLDPGGWSWGLIGPVSP